MEEFDDLLIGKHLDGYVVEERIGRGGMGVVYRALDTGLRRKVAVKTLFLPSANDEMRRRFEREATLAAGVSHPNVVKVFDFGAAEGHLYLVMELIDGPDLAALIAEGPIALPRALELFRQMSGGLHDVHAMELIHRDVKPSNVLIQNAGRSGERALITDFGIARAAETQTALTIGPIGTPEYMAPEATGMERATERADQYALALLLYEMLAGEHLFPDGDFPAVHRDEPLPDLARRLPGTPSNLRAALARALDKEPADRFVSVEAFADAVLRDDVSDDAPPLDVSMERVLAAEYPRGLTVEDLLARVNDVAPAPVTAVQVDGRAELFPQLFRRLPDGRIALRHPPRGESA